MRNHSHLHKTLARLTLVFLLSLLTSYGRGHELPPKLIRALHEVETGGRYGPIVGDNGQALGPFQIHRKYWVDSGVSGKYKDCANYNYSVRVITAYLNRYGSKYIASNNLEALARIHKGGPNGPNKSETAKYWQKVKYELDKLPSK